MGVKDPDEKKTTRGVILKALEEAGENPISGENLAKVCGISRTAVWKAIQQLKQQGYGISAAQNRGYRLESSDERLLEESITAALDEDLKSEVKIQVLQSVNSTNDYVKQFASGSDGHGTLVLAEEQTAGRGRLGRSFFSPRGTGLYMSLLYKPQGNFSQLSGFDPARYTIAAAVAVCRVLRAGCGLDAKIKWVNDIFLDGKKICGILTDGIANLENRTIDYVIIGIGVNVSTEIFPLDICEIVSSLAKSGRKLSRNVLAARITSQLLRILSAYEHQKIIDEYKKLSLILGREITVENGNKSFFAKAIDIDEQGRLLVKNHDGKILTLVSGEVKIRV